MKKDEYNPHVHLHQEDIEISKETKVLLQQARQIYEENFPDKKTWYGRCIFISWFCSKDDCKFCFRSTKRFQETHPDGSRRSMGSVLLEALFCKLFNWRIEFLTGGYGIMPVDDLIEYIKNVSAVYGEKMWLNLGVMSPKNIEKVKPYVKGMVSSLETCNPELHKYVCPSNPIEPYDKMFTLLTENHPDMKKSVAIIVGLGEELEDIRYLFDFIEKQKLDRVTVYALKPVRGTEYTKGPSVEEYLQWLASIRIKFPKLEIIAGTNLRRCEEVGWLMEAGVNAFTKYPATKQFATKKAKLMEDLIIANKRDYISNLTKLPTNPEIDWDAEIEKLEIKEEYKQEMNEKLGPYLKKFKNPVDKDPKFKIL